MKISFGKSKKIALDMLINLAGTGIGLVALQLILYPILAKRIDGDSYGQMQSIMSLVYIVGGTLGSTLSTTRLVRRVVYEEKQTEGDFALLSLVCALVTVVLAPAVLLLAIGDVDTIDVILVSIVSVLNFSANYYIVGFRLRINYRAIFIDKVIACAGYFLGYGLFCLTRRWEFIFLVSFLLETLFCAIRSKLGAEPIRKTPLLRETGGVFINLGIASLLSRALTYFDKLLLYPLLGGTAVSIYFVANVFGKLIMMAIEPITNVILTYISKRNTITRSVWKTVIPIALAGCALMYLVCMLISKPVIQWFYPEWAAEAVHLVPLTTLSLAISAFNNIMWPFTIKALESYKQIIINAVGIAVYIAGALVSYSTYGIRGYCIALLISHLAKLAVMAVLCIEKIHDYPETDERDTTA